MEFIQDLFDGIDNFMFKKLTIQDAISPSVQADTAMACRR